MKKMSKVYKLSMAAIAASLVLVNCSSSIEDLVGGDDESVSPTFTGQFVDTYVKGLNYTCTGWVDGEDNQLTGTGVTNAQGEFTCNEGDLVEFSVGSYVIGSDHAWDNPIKSPYDMNLGSTTAIINLAQLLQTIDDKTTDGALTIPADFAVLNGVEIALDHADFDALMADELNVASLVSEDDARAHLDGTLASFAPAPAPAPAPETETETDPTDTAALESFVSGKDITFTANAESMTATFAPDGDYFEESDSHSCEGNWSLQSSNTIQTTGGCGTSTFEFIGELQTGMTVVHSDAGELKITNIAAAVDPDA